MMSTRAKRFWWAKQRRRGEIPLFRLLVRRWRPLARVRPDPDTIEARRFLTAKKPRRTKPLPIWNPWLWTN
jgi:hypothetical protein